MISDLDLLRWAKSVNAHRPARQIARSPAVMITADASLYEATELTVEHATDHLVVIDDEHGGRSGSSPRRMSRASSLKNRPTKRTRGRGISEHRVATPPRAV